MVNSITFPLSSPPAWASSVAAGWLGPMMKLPSAPAGGTDPSVNSFAVTNPGLFGSRVGGVGRAAGGVAGTDWAKARLINPTGHNERASPRRRRMVVVRRVRNILKVLNILCG